MDMQQLQDLEDIRQLKSRYFRLMDTQPTIRYNKHSPTDRM